MTENETKPQTANETLSPGDHDDAQSKSRNANHIDSEIKSQQSEKQKEYGGRAGPDPTRFGDWERNGRCVDF